MSNEAKVKITWGGYVSIELTGAQWGKVETDKKKSTIETMFSGLYEVVTGAGFKMTFDRVEGLQRISITNVLDVFGDGKQYVMQAGSPDLHEALCAALSKFTIWTKMKPEELPLTGVRSTRF